VALSAVGWLGCGSDEETSVEITAAADEAPPPDETGEPAAAVVIEDMEPEHDGTLVAAGPYPVEVVAHESGEVYAHVRGDAPPPADVVLTVDVPVERRRSGRPVRMIWNPRNERWEGRVRRLEVVPGPLDVHITVGGVEHHGHVDVIVVAPVVEVRVDTPRRRRRKHKHKHRRKHRRGHGHGRHGGVEIRFH
jgi:hypothetical protein